MTFDLNRFWRFCSQLKINSKEYGTIPLAEPYTTQKWAMHELARGLSEGIHDFTFLKVRQIGLSTSFLALDLYWPFTHPGLDGTIVTHNEKTFVNFRTTLTEYYRSLPKSFKPASPSHNKDEFVFRHADDTISRLQYEIAGTRATGGEKLGRAKGNAYLHATEMAFWGDQAGYQSLRNMLAEINPNRLYVWESTANGYNEFEAQWRVACKATTMRAIFIGWWAHAGYRFDRSQPEQEQRFKVYWGESGKMTNEERRLARDVALLYGPAMEFVWGTREITPEQIAWYRWYSTEKTPDPTMAQQEMPWTEHQAFVTTGAQYFSGRELTESHKRINQEPQPTPFRIETQHRLTDSRVYECRPQAANLLLFAKPEEKAYYVLGADPAYGSSDWADRFVISVWRCYADGCDQVAEYATADTLPYAFAWVICYLGGCFAPCAWNLEINGPGTAVLAEIDNLKRERFAGDPKDRQTMKNFLGGMSEFLYTRMDSLTRTPTARGTQSTLQMKKTYMAVYKDYFTRGMAVVHSRALLEEMRWITEEPGYAPSGSSRHKDDRVIAAALAIFMWHSKLRTKLMHMNITRARTQDTPERQTSVLEAMVERQRKLLGMPRQQ